MPAGQWEPGLLGVIEFPHPPTVRRVTACAVGSQSALVDVAAAMTGDTVARRAREGPRRMALAAADDHVHAQQREIDQVVIEVDARGPAVAVVTGLASRLQRATMYVITPVAAGTRGGQLLCCQASRVTGMAIELRVRSQQREFRFLRMLEGQRLPRFIAVTGAAIFTEPACMRIDVSMAADAGLRQFILEAPTAMTVRAIE